MVSPPAEAAPAAARRSCPFGHGGGATSSETEPPWTAEAEALLQSLPVGMSRDLSRQAVTAIAAKNGAREITAVLVQQVLETFRSGSAEVVESMPWDEDARAGLSRAPDMVRGALIREVETWAKQRGLPRIDAATVRAVKETWQTSGQFHLNPTDPRHRGD
jgi:hypothetical protein